MYHQTVEGLKYCWLLSFWGLVEEQDVHDFDSPQVLSQFSNVESWYVVGGILVRRSSRYNLEQNESVTARTNRHK